MKQFMAISILILSWNSSFSQAQNNPLVIESKDGLYSITITPFVDAMNYGTDLYYNLPFDSIRRNEEALFSIELTNNSNQEITISSVQNSQESVVTTFPKSIGAGTTVKGTIRTETNNEASPGDYELVSTLLIIGEPGEMRYNLRLIGTLE